MPVLTAFTFDHMSVPISDQIVGLPRHRVAQAAHHAGYVVSNASIRDALSNTTVPHYMTAAEFEQFCASNQKSYVAPDAMAHAIVVVAPSNVITRASLESLLQHKTAASAGTNAPSSSHSTATAAATEPTEMLSAEEVDALFETLDTTCSGAITGDDLMRAFHGEDGVRVLHHMRRSEVDEAKARAHAASVAEEARVQAEAAAAEAAAREQELQRVREAEQREAAARAAAAAKAQQEQREAAERQRREMASRAKKTKTCC